MTTVSIACDVSQPDGTEFLTARLEFALSGPDYDTAAGEAIPAVTTYVDLDASGVGTADLWPVDLGTRNTFYAVVLRGSVTRDGRTSEVVSTLGRIQPQSSGGQALADLLAQSSGGIVVGSTIYETLADAVAAAELAAQQSAASAPWNYPTLADLVADTTAWADGSRLRVRGGAEHEVDSTDPAPDFVTAGLAPLIVRPNLSGEYSVAAFVSASEDGGDIAPAVLRAAARAHKNGGGLLKLAPANYTFASVCDLGSVSTSAQIDLRGANIVGEADVVFLRADYPVWEDVQAISAVDGADYWGGRKDITVTDGADFSVGDLVKVVSDDKQRCTRPDVGATSYRRGWMAYVEAVAGDVVTLDRPCPWDLTTNPRIGRMPRRRYGVTGGVIGYEGGHEADWRAPPMLFCGVSDLTVDAEIEKTYSAAISLVGCFEPVVRARGRDLRNNESNQQYGYLVNDGSYFSRVDVVAGRNRHAYTTNQQLIAADLPDLTLYGATYGALVTGQSHGNTQAGFDTHHGSERCYFAGVKVSGGTTGGGGIVIRGVDHIVTSPEVHNGKEGIYVYTETGVTDGVTTVEIVEPTVDVDRRVLDVDTASKVTLRGGSLRSRKYGNCVEAAGDLVLRGTISLRPGGTADVTGARAIDLFDCAVDARGSTLLVDMQDIPGDATEYGIINGAGAGASSWAGGKVQTFNDDGLSSVFYKQGGSVTFAPEEIVTQKQGVNPKTSAAVTGAAGAGFTGPWRWRTEDGAAASDYIEVTVSANYVIPLLGRGDREIAARLYASTSRTLGAIPAGYVGQVLTISVTAASGQTVTVKHGASYNTVLPGGTDAVLGAERSLRLMWSGTRWVIA